MASEQLEKPSPDIEKLREKYRGIVVKTLDKDPKWPEILKIGLGNSEGQLMIAGGYIYRPISEFEYKIKTRRENGIIDVDFVAGQLSTKPYTLRNLGWRERRTKYGNPAFWNKQYCVVVSDLNSYPRPTLEDLIDNTPLDIQSIGIVIRRDEPFLGELIGNKGILAIHHKQVKINNRIEAVYEIYKKIAHEAQLVVGSEEFNQYIKGFDMEKILREFVEKKASQLHFTPVFD